MNSVMRFISVSPITVCCVNAGAETCMPRWLNGLNIIRVRLRSYRPEVLAYPL